MKAPLICYLLVVALVGCAHVDGFGGRISRVRALNDALVAGRYRYPDVFWSTTVELRSDHSFRYEQFTDTFEHTSFEGTWALDADHVVVRSDALKTGQERYLVVRDTSGDLGLLTERSLADPTVNENPRLFYFQTCWRGWAKEPNKALEPTTTAVTPRAFVSWFSHAQHGSAHVAPAVVVAHL